MSCQQVPTTPAFNPYPRSVQVGEFEVAIGGGIWVAIRAETVAAWKSYAPQFITLPHPSPRNQNWLKQNPWFDREIVPMLRKHVADALA